MKLSKTALFALVAMTALALAAPAAGQMPDRAKLREMTDDPKAPIEVVSSYLGMVRQIHESVSDPLSVLIVAQHDMKDLLRAMTTPAEAVKVFRGILDGLEDPAARAAVHFAIIDVYQAANEPEKALAELKTLVEETKIRLNEKK